jgi:hypothetical protein
MNKVFNELEKVFNNSLVLADSAGIKSDENLSEDDLSKIKSILTSLGNRHYIKSKQNLNLHVEICYRFFGHIFDKYKQKHGLKPADIIFLYKGGNVLKRFYDNNRRELFGEINKLLSEQYSDYFDKSDNDHVILINPYIEDYDKHFERINDLSYHILAFIRDFILARKETFLGYYTLSADSQNSLLKDTAAEIKKLFPQLIRINTATEFDKKIYEKDGQILVARINDKKNPINISYNTVLKFKREKFVASFNLIRSRICFSLTFDNNNLNRNSFSEHLDIAFVKRDDAFFDEIKRSEDFYDFAAKYIEVFEQPYKYQLFSVEYLLKDLVILLFEEQPWKNKKYIKRVNRMMFLVLLLSIIDKQLNSRNLDAEIKKFRGKSFGIYKVINDSLDNSAASRSFEKLIDELTKKNIEILTTLKEKLGNFKISGEKIYDLST